MQKEIWKDVVGYEGLYKVSNLGTVISLHRGTTRIMKPAVATNGYHQIFLSKNGVRTLTRVHRIVAMAFLPNVENKPLVNHINGIKTDNNLSNLEWVAFSENGKHAFATGLNHTTEKVRKAVSQNAKACRKLNAEQVRELRSLRTKFGYGPDRLSRITGISRSLINHFLYENSYSDIA
jgi:hypothetical protein